MFNIKDVIDNLDKGYYTQLQKKGALPFSTKTKYLLLLIRAIICRRPILLIDDMDKYFTENETTQIIDIIHTLRRDEYTLIVTQVSINSELSESIETQNLLPLDQAIARQAMPVNKQKN